MVLQAYGRITATGFKKTIFIFAVKDTEAIENFRAEINSIRKKIVVKRSGLNALLHNDNTDEKMKNLTLVKFIAAMAIFLNATLAAASPEAFDLNLNELLQVAQENNPELQASESTWKIYENKIPQTGVLDDPILSIGLNNYPVDSWASNETPMSGKTLKLSQNFPFPGKLSAKKEKSKQQSLWHLGVYEEAKLLLAWKVKDAYYSLVFANHALAVTDKNLKVLEDFIRLTETNYEIGKGLQQDILKAQVERSKLIDRTYTFKQEMLKALAELSNLTDRDLSSANYKITDETSAPPIELTLEELHDISIKNRPLFNSYRALIEQNKLQMKLARLEFKPNFKLGVSYTFREPNPGDDGTDFAGVEFGMNIPIFVGKRKAAIGEAKAAIINAERQMSSFRNKVQFNIHDLFLKAKKSEEQLELYKNGLIPQATLSFEAALSGYQVGKIDFLALLDSLMTIYKYELEYYRVLSDGKRWHARLQAETGSINL